LRARAFCATIARMIPAKSFAAGFAIAAAELAIAYAALAVAFADRPAFLDHWFYKDLVAWQTGLGAIIGLWGLAAVAAWNFKKTRDRDKDLRDEEARALASALCEEIKENARYTEHLLDEWRKLEKQGATLNVIEAKQWNWPTNIYKAHVRTLSLLDEAFIKQIIQFYSPIIQLEESIIRWDASLINEPIPESWQAQTKKMMGETISEAAEITPKLQQFSQR